MKLAVGFAGLALLGLIAASVWATSHISIVPAIESLLTQPAAGTNPWFVATLIDTYFAFLWFWLWVAYKERSLVSKLVWLVLILGLGNMAMAAYVLIQVWTLPRAARIEDLLLRRP